MLCANPFQQARILGQLLLKRNWSVATAESCTGGGLASAITAVPGASFWFDRGVVTYHNKAKIELLGVNADVLEKHGAVSAEVAIEMAQGILQHSPAEFSLSITGIAGPTGGTEEKPVGTVYFGMGVRNKEPHWRLKRFEGGRKNIRDCAVNFALDWLVDVVTVLGD